MKTKIVKIRTRKAGGTAKGNALKYGIDLPSSWVKDLGITANTDVLISQEGQSIIIRQKAPAELEAFRAWARERHHRLVTYHYYDGNILCSTILADFSCKQVAVQNYVEDITRTAFGLVSNPLWHDLENFLEDRCISRTRVGIDQYLKSIGLSEYDPFEIVKKSGGRMGEDNQWIEIL